MSNEIMRGIRAVQEDVLKRTGTQETVFFAVNGKNEIRIPQPSRHKTAAIKGQ